ncbi:sigma factor-like helix-turn-helix DNA-binding protein [Streptomyces sp. NPDC050485]|uniref:sigma factor-like helix-turn-helix DNA-binding protein n=1 Tax=Streptomyces sp. NPDC050485 TaxID=3365617 RepID=UPI0037B414C9
MTQSPAETNDAMSALPNPKERRRLREAKSLSEKQLATAVGVTEATVRSWEKGRTTPRGRRRESYARLLATIEAELAAVADRPAVDAPAETAEADGRKQDASHPAALTGGEAPGTTHQADALGAAHPVDEIRGREPHAFRPAPETSDDKLATPRPADESSADELPTPHPADETRGEEPDASRLAAARAQPPACGPAKPPAKPHAANRRPKPAAKRAAKPPATPHTRHDHPSPTPAAPAASVPEPAPAASASASVPEPAKALKADALTGASTLTGGSARTLPERPEPTDAEPDRADGADGSEQRGGTPPKARSPLPSIAFAPEHPEPLTGRTPAEAFDALYVSTAPALARQAYLLTGRTRLSRESVERAFHLAWENWPEVATDRDPAGWVRAAAYEYALTPWHRFRRAHKRPDHPPAEPERRALLDALLDLPPVYRRTVLLYDGLGLDLPETAAETEASTPAAANRLLHARAAIARRVPAVAEAGDPGALSAALCERIADLAQAEPASVTKLPSAPVVRIGGERRRRFWTRAAIAFTALIIGATAFTVVTVPHHHVRPVPVGERVGGVPANNGPQQLSIEDLELRDKLRQEPAHGPERLVLEIR